MSSRIWPLAACVTSAAALYVTRGVLDQVLVEGRAFRIALLPPWQALAGFLGLTALGMLLLDRLIRARGLAGPADTRLRELVRPALLTVVLLLPFAPVIADRLPVLQMLAGPMSATVWLALAALVIWTLWQVGAVSVAWSRRLSRSQGAVLVGICTALVASVAATKLTRTALFPAGDEPHYLVMAQSVWRDGDLKIENNHQRGDYHEYYAQDLEPHYLTRGSDGEIYSVHPVGLPLLLAPVYGLGGYTAVVWALIGMAALAAALAWKWTATVLDAPGAATFALVAIVGSAPFLLNTFTVYPEIAAALAVMIAVTSPRPWVVGLACGALPWLSTKYAPMSAILLFLRFVTVPGPGPLVSDADTSIRRVAAFAVPYGALLIGWFSFFHAYWGSPWPQAPYGALTQTTVWNLVFGAPGLLFDQEYGLLAYSPAYALAATGLWSLWRAGGERRRWAIAVLTTFGALLATVGAFRIWWGGSASPARPLASALLLLALPMAAAFHDAAAGSARRAAQHLLVWLGAGILGTLTFAQGGLLINNGRDGTSALLEYWSPLWQSWTLAPTFIHHEAPTALLHSVWWLAIAAGTALTLRRWHSATPARAAVAAGVALSAALLVIAITFPLLPSDPPWPAVDLRARARIAALDAFDVHARPAALVYNPLRKMAAADIVDRFALEVGPGTRTEQQPVRVIHNGRFSLPAGRYRVDVDWVPDTRLRGPLPLSLQIGRIGPAMATWMVDPAGGSRWQADFDLPVDTGFVGFRGALDLERAIARIAIVPLAIIDRALRPRVPPVLAASRYPTAAVFFHDEQLYPEPNGFWTMGKRRMVVTMAPANEGALTIRTHSGPRPNRVTFRASGWTQTVSLLPERPEEVTLPAPARGVLELEIETESGFIPSDLDPSSKDRRFLGVWIEVS